LRSPGRERQALQAAPHRQSCREAGLGLGQAEYSLSHVATRIGRVQRRLHSARLPGNWKLALLKCVRPSNLASRYSTETDIASRSAGDFVTAEEIVLDNGEGQHFFLSQFQAVLPRKSLSGFSPVRIITPGLGVPTLTNWIQSKRSYRA
jgi:hypothetical protein